jgi:hypothetical protein
MKVGDSSINSMRLHAKARRGAGRRPAGNWARTVGDPEVANDTIRPFVRLPASTGPAISMVTSSDAGKRAVGPLA